MQPSAATLPAVGRWRPRHSCRVLQLKAVLGHHPSEAESTPQLRNLGRQVRENRAVEEINVRVVSALTVTAHRGTLAHMHRAWRLLGGGGFDGQ
jgi:hypothetical protein